MLGLRRDTLALALGRRFAAALAPAFLAVHATIAALALAFLRIDAPGLSWAMAMELAGDALVAGFDVTFTGVVAAAACVTVHGAAARGQLLTVALAGRAPWRAFVPTAVALAAITVGLWWWVGHATPQALYRLRYPLADATQAARLLPPGEPRSLGGWTVAVGAVDDDALRDVAFARTEPAAAMALVAADARATVRPLDERTATVDAEFRQGRWLARDRQRVLFDAGFDRLIASTDARGFLRPDKATLLPLAYYRDDELPRYREQALARLRAGLAVDETAAERTEALGLVRGLRAAAAAQPLLAFVVIVGLLARPRPRGRAVAVAACVAIGVGLVARIALEARAGKVGDLQQPWLACLPALATVALAAPFARRWSGVA